MPKNARKPTTTQPTASMSSSSSSAAYSYESGQAFASTFGNGAQWMYDQLTAFFPDASSLGLGLDLTMMPDASTVTNMLSQLSTLVQGAMPNTDVLVALAQLNRTDYMAADVAGQISSVIFANPDLHEAMRNFDPRGAAAALTTALNNQDLVGALGHLFMNRNALVGMLSSDKIFSLLLLHVVKKAAQPVFNALVDNLSMVAGTLVNDDIGKKVIDAAIVRACPEHKADLLKGLDFANGDAEAKAAFKQFVVGAMATTAPEDRRKILEAVFSDALGSPSHVEENQIKASKKADKGALKKTKATETLNVGKKLEEHATQTEQVEELIDSVAQEEPSHKRTFEKKLDELINVCADQEQFPPCKTVD